MVNFTVLQGIGILPFRLLKLSNVMLAWIMRVIFSRTPRDYAEASAPPFLNYGEELPQIIVIFVIVLVYSSIAPIILLFGAIYFFFGYITYKYLLLYGKFFFLFFFFF